MSRKMYSKILKEVMETDYAEKQFRSGFYTDKFFEDQIEYLEKSIKDDKSHKKIVLALYITVCIFYIFYVRDVTMISVIFVSLFSCSFWSFNDKSAKWIRDNEISLCDINFSYDMHKIKMKQFEERLKKENAEKENLQDN